MSTAARNGRVSCISVMASDTRRCWNRARHGPCPTRFAVITVHAPCHRVSLPCHEHGPCLQRVSACQQETCQSSCQIYRDMRACQCNFSVACQHGAQKQRRSITDSQSPAQCMDLGSAADTIANHLLQSLINPRLEAGSPVCQVLCSSKHSAGNTDISAQQTVTTLNPSASLQLQ